MTGMNDETGITKKVFGVGRLVCSKAGHDKGRYYLVFGRSNDGKYLLLVDGTKRGVANPKKKNSFHLQIINKVSQELVNKLNNQEIVQDAEIKDYLADLNIDQ